MPGDCARARPTETSRSWPITREHVLQALSTVTVDAGRHQPRRLGPPVGGGDRRGRAGDVLDRDRRRPRRRPWRRCARRRRPSCAPSPASRASSPASPRTGPPARGRRRRRRSSRAGRRSAPSPKAQALPGRASTSSPSPPARAASASRRPPATSPSALQAQGLKVGLLDADIYGPSMPKLFGIHGKPRVLDGPHPRADGRLRHQGDVDRLPRRRGGGR